MVIPIIITFVSLVTLIILHELGHFWFAKRFNMKVDEFGVFFPPRLWAKKIGETVYSINALPLGAFVQIQGEDGEEPNEDEDVDPERSFVNKPIWQRALVLLGGVLMFWVIAAVLLGITSSAFGLPGAVEDDEAAQNAKVQITQIAEDSPADEAGVTPFTEIAVMKAGDERIEPTRTEEVQQFIAQHEGEITLTLARQERTEQTVTVTPDEEGKIGIGLVRTGWQTTPWYQAPVVGVQKTVEFTYRIGATLVGVVGQLIGGEQPEGAEVRGPIGIGDLFVQAFTVGPGYFLYLLSIISIYLAIFNILPIPALDGGRLLFLGIEKVRGNPVSAELEQRVNATFFLLLVSVLIIVSVRDVIRFIL